MTSVPRVPSRVVRAPKEERIHGGGSSGIRGGSPATQRGVPDVVGRKSVTDRVEVDATMAVELGLFANWPRGASSSREVRDDKDTRPGTRIHVSCRGAAEW